MGLLSIAWRSRIPLRPFGRSVGRAVNTGGPGSAAAGSARRLGRFPRGWGRGLLLATLVAIGWAGARVAPAADLPPTEVAANRAAADALFAQGGLLELRLEIPDEGVESLRKNPRLGVSAVVREGATAYTNVMVHLKGSRGSFRPVDEKPGLTLKFPRNAPQGPFHGLRKFHLNNGSQDGSFLSEWVCGELFRAAEVPAARATHAWVELNGRKLGLYVLLESLDRDFLSRYFTNTQGNLYGQSDNADVDEPLHRESGRGEDTHADLKALAAVLRESDRAKLWEQLPQVLEVDRYLSFMAMEVMLCHWDGYTFARHNFRVYQNLDTGKLMFIPHDMDQMMEDARVPIQPGANGLVSRAILRIPEARTRYRERFSALFTNVFLAPAITQRIDRRLAQLLPAVAARDPELAGNLENKANALKDRVENRVQGLEEQFTQPIPANPFLHGLVLDADTQKPIPHFTIVAGFRAGENAVRWDRTRVFRGLRGVFDTDLSNAKLPQTPSHFRFETEGYLPAVVRYTPPTNDDDMVYKIFLKKGGRVAGTVRLPTGTPANGGQVALLTESSSPVLGRAQFTPKPGLPILALRDLARFSFSADPEAQTIVAVHKTGFAETPVEDLAANPKITLQPWGRVEGSMTGPDNPDPSGIATLTAELLVPNLFKGFYAGVLNLDFSRFTVELPANGPFALENVPPGERFLWRSVPIDDPADLQPSNLSFVGQRLLVKPGETNRLVWGETEPSIKGRIVQPPGNPPDNADPNAILIPEVPVKLGCLRFDTGGADAPAPVEYFFTLGDQDAFRVKGALPLSSRAELRVYAPPLWLGVARREIRFPAPAGGAASPALDLGAIELDPIRPVKLGDPAPLFEVKDLEGAPLKLADFRGAGVLLYFWAAWGSPQLALLPGLQEVCDKYPHDPRLVLLGLSLDRHPETARRYVRRTSMKGRQGYLGEWFHTSLPAQYGVAGIPSVVFIGPDGKILARDLPLTGLPAAIEELLNPDKTK